MDENRKIVAVSDELTPIRQMLEDRGYEVVPVTDRAYTEADAIVITGMTRNVAGMEDIRTKAPVIDATGQDAEEVVRHLEERLTLS